ncbi:MAG: protein phosphatase CheZ [Deltaproteobacteria bacterium]|nr:protein phosphatase CheZ [Deltaproteobacteria bacterium]
MAELIDLLQKIDDLIANHGEVDRNQWEATINEAIEVSKVSNCQNILWFLESLREMFPSASEEMRQLIQYALATVLEEVSGSGDDLSKARLAEIYDILGVAFPEVTSNQEDDGDDIKILESIVEGENEKGHINLEDLKKLFERFGAEIIEEGTDDNYFCIRFPARQAEVERLQRILSFSDPSERITDSFENEAVRKILIAVKEFMVAFAQGDLEHSKKVLIEMSDIQREGGLYHELGQIARQLHESLKNFGATLDPQLREYVEKKLPDSGNRLEHIMKLTESAANTTMDHVELLQERKEKELERAHEALERVSLLHPLGDKAKEVVQEIHEDLNQIIELGEQDKEDLITILTAQDYQDLTGQIILKIINLLRDLEQKLVNLIKTFGVRPYTSEIGEKKDLLYGPAYEAKEDALHSQDEVDALLAQFGF